jgi:hypothetical protein
MEANYALVNKAYVILNTRLIRANENVSLNIVHV